MALLLARRLCGAGAEARQHVAPIRRVEVPPGVAQQASPGGPAAAAQHLVGSREPGLRVLLVRVGDEAWVGLEIARGPLPDVTHHLPAAVRAVAGGMAPDVDRPSGAAVEVGAALIGRIVSPGESPLPRRGGPEPPPPLGGKPPPRPAAIPLRLEPANVDGRLVQRP